jgi:hypothetical protein
VNGSFLAEVSLVALTTALSRHEARSHLNGNKNRGGFVALIADFRGHEVALLLPLDLVKGHRAADSKAARFLVSLWLKTSSASLPVIQKLIRSPQGSEIGRP